MTRLNGKVSGKPDSGKGRPVRKALVERAFRGVQAQMGSMTLGPFGDAPGAFKVLPQRLHPDGDELLSASAQCTLQELELVLKESLVGQRPAIALEFDPVTRYCTGWKLLGGRHGNP